MGNTVDTLSVIFASIAVVGLAGGLLTRFVGPKPKGIGVRFIRYAAIVVALPIAATLLLQDKEVGALVSIAVGALGVAFAGYGNSEN